MIRRIELGLCAVLCFCCYALQAQPIIETSCPEGWMIRTNNSCYQILLNEQQRPMPVFYGSAEQFDYRAESGSWTNYGLKPSNWAADLVDEIPVRGDRPFKTPVVEVIFSNGVRDADLVYESHEISEQNGLPVLRIVCKDKSYPLEVVANYIVYSELDIIEKWIEVKNTGTKKEGEIIVENLLSGSIVLPHDDYTLTQLCGYQMNEFQTECMPISTGLKTIESKAFKSNLFAPWFSVQGRNTTADSGEAWFGAVHYSGNWVLKFDKIFNYTLQIAGGINFWDTDLTLSPGESFVTPKISFGYTSNGTDDVALKQADYVRRYILPEKHRDELRPVLYNGWENSYWAVDEQQQIDLATAASEIGVELFVVDDGWFKARTAKDTGLGNYEVDRNKFPNGLKPVIDHVHSLGMKFGLWVEPESVSDNADSYVANRDWTFQYPDREKGLYRTMLNLANEEVYEYLLSELSKLLSENDIDFIKWDQNTYVTEPGWAGAPKGAEREARIRHTENVYRLVEELRHRFPNVIFETCASGGGRVDLGMLSLMDQAWVSDNTDPLDRLFIQHGYAKMLPANTMVSWVTSMTREQPVPLDFRFDVSMGGVLGIGANIVKWNDEQKQVARDKIEIYKRIRPTVQHGDYYSLLSPHTSDRVAVQYVSKDKRNVVLMCYNMAVYVEGGRSVPADQNRIRFKGLSSESLYKVRESAKVYSGGYLMEIGLEWPVARQPLSSIIMELEKLED